MIVDIYKFFSRFILANYWVGQNARELFLCTRNVVNHDNLGKDIIFVNFTKTSKFGKNLSTKKSSDLQRSSTL